MSDWANTKDRKGKKNKKKQAASMSEPVDLEAGEHINEPIPPDITKLSIDAVATPPVPSTADDSKDQNMAETKATESLQSTKMTEDLAAEVVKALPKVAKAAKAPIPPPPKAKPTTTSKETTTETTKGDSLAAPKTVKPVDPRPFKADTTEERTKDEGDMEAPGVTKTTNSTALKSNATNKKAKKETLQKLDFATESKALEAKTVQDAGKGKLSINSLVLAWSFAPEPPDGDPPVKETLGLPPLPPFDHRSFSRINNVPQRTTNDHGPLLEVQTNKGTFAKVHRNVLRQSSKYLENLCMPEYARARENPHEISWSSKSSFKGVTSTYIHWLYNGNLPTSIIDVSDKTKIGAVLLNLAKEYVFSSKVLDTLYRNAIMDHFVTIHVRTRKLTFGSVIDVVYKGTKKDAPMRRLLADMHAFVVMDDVRKLDMMEHQPKAFVWDVRNSVLMLRPYELDEWWWFLEGATYYC